jgi:hypothetical protein
VERWSGCHLGGPGIQIPVGLNPHMTTEVRGAASNSAYGYPELWILRFAQGHREIECRPAKIRTRNLPFRIPALCHIIKAEISSEYSQEPHIPQNN